MKEIIMEQTCKVLVRVDDAGRVVEINSDAFVTDSGGWVEIDSGRGDKYRHAQGNYLPRPLRDARGLFRYKLVYGKPVERTPEEIEGDYTPPEIRPTTDQRLTTLEESTDDIILMLADMIGG